MNFPKPPEQKLSSSPQNTSQNIFPQVGKMPKFIFLGFLSGGGLLLVLFISQGQNLYLSLTSLENLIEVPYQEWLDQQNISNPLFLLLLAFGGGLFASISPCILALLPINLSYIGTLNITSRWLAFTKASLFTLGVTTVFSIFGLFSALASIISSDFLGYTYILIGTIIVVMGLSIGGLIHLPLPQNHISLPFMGPYGVGLTFALLSTPCGSPVLFAVLIAAGNTGSQIISILTMISYAFGYTAIIFLASLCTGLVKQSRFLLKHSDWIMSLGSVGLIIAGGYYLVNGIIWFLPTPSN